MAFLSSVTFFLKIISSVRVQSTFNVPRSTLPLWEILFFEQIIYFVDLDNIVAKFWVFEESEGATCYWKLSNLFSVIKQKWNWKDEKKITLFRSGCQVIHWGLLGTGRLILCLLSSFPSQPWSPGSFYQYQMAYIKPQYFFIHKYHCAS